MSDRGKRLIEAMRIKGLHKQHALAHQLGVNVSNITRWKKNGPMSLDSAVAICNALDISIDWLVSGKGRMQRVGIVGETASDEARDLCRAAKGACGGLTTKSCLRLIDFLEAVAKR